MSTNVRLTHQEVSLCDAIDRLLHKGVVLRGEVCISVADVELVYLGLQVLLASADTARKFLGAQPAETPMPAIDAPAQLREIKP
jgi:hypothetical protein